MKINRNYVIIGLIAFMVPIAMFCLWAFCLWEIEPHKWGQWSRTFYVLFSILIAMFSIIAYMDTKQFKSNNKNN